MSMRRALRFWAAPEAMVIAALVACAVGARAQGFATLGVSSYVGQNVSSVDIAGRPDISFGSVQDLISVEPDKPLTEQEVNDSIAALKQHPGVTGVRIDLLPSASGVQVTFVLRPAVYIGMYEFPGAMKEFTYPRLLQVANYNAQMPYSAPDIRSAEDALVKFFRQQGYFKVEVNSELAEEKEYGLIDVLFHTHLGIRARIGEVKLEGATPKETAYLQRKLHSIMARLRGSSLRPGMTYSLDRLQSATKYMQSALSSQNYVTGSVKLVSAEYDPDTNLADITFTIKLGPVVKVQTVGAKLNGFFHPHTLSGLVPIYVENDVNDELIHEGQQNILYYFQKKGYFDTKVDVTQSKTPSGILIVYDIHKAGRGKVTSVTYQGNHRFTEKQLNASVNVKKANWLWFSHGAYSQELLRTSVGNLTDTYRAAGYSEATVTPKITRHGTNIDITFVVEQGPLNRVRSLTIEGNNTMPESQFAPHGLNLGPGKPYSQELVAKDRSLIVANYLTAGYLNAAFRATASQVAGEPHELNVTYQISEGPRVIIADVITDGKRLTKQSLINKEVRLSSGQPLSQNRMLTAESRLYNLETFDWAEIDPKSVIIDQTHEDVVVKVHERKRNSIVYGFGFQVLNRGGAIPSGTVAVPGLPVIGLPPGFVPSEKTYFGPDGTLEYTRRNLWGRAQTLTVSAFAGRLDQRASVAYTDPFFQSSNWHTTASISGEHDEQNPIFTAETANLGYQFQLPVGKTVYGRKASNIFFRYNLQLTDLSNLLIPQLVPPNQLNVVLSSLVANWVHDTRDNVLNATKGIYENYALTISPYWLGSKFSFAQFLEQTSFYKNLHQSGIIWANSVRVGLEQAFDGSEVPLSSRFFAGGGSTLRGFPLDGAGPQEIIPACANPSVPSTCVKITVPRGGNELLILNTELRYPLNFIKDGLGLVTFYDGGNVFPSIGFHDFTSLYSNNVGIGFRYATPVGPIRIDIGRNLNPVPGISPTQYFVTLGQAF